MTLLIYYEGIGHELRADGTLHDLYEELSINDGSSLRYQGAVLPNDATPIADSGLGMESAVHRSINKYVNAYSCVCGRGGCITATSRIAMRNPTEAQLEKVKTMELSLKGGRCCHSERRVRCWNFYECNYNIYSPKTKKALSITNAHYRKLQRCEVCGDSDGDYESETSHGLDEDMNAVELGDIGTPRIRAPSEPEWWYNSQRGGYHSPLRVADVHAVEIEYDYSFTRRAWARYSVYKKGDVICIYNPQRHDMIFYIESYRAHVKKVVILSHKPQGLRMRARINGHKRLLLLRPFDAQLFLENYYKKEGATSSDYRFSKKNEYCFTLVDR